MKIYAAAAAAIVAAASSVALSSDLQASDGDKGLTSCSSLKKEVGCGLRTDGGKNDRFGPKFDGLRFIETLVTAHR